MKAKIIAIVSVVVVLNLLGLNQNVYGESVNSEKTGLMEVLESALNEAYSFFFPTETVYVDRPVEKVVEKVVYVDRPVEKVVEKVVYVDNTPRTVSPKESAKNKRTAEINGVLSAFPQYKGTFYGTDDERYEIESFVNHVYRTYVKAYYSIDRDIYICCAASSKESKALAVQHAFNDKDSYNGLIVFFNSNKYNMWDDMLTSIRGDAKKTGDVAIPYKGKTIYINEWTMGTVIHEILHVAETFESYYPQRQKGLYKHHDCPESIEAERQLGNNPFLKGSKIRYKECQAYNNEW